MANDEYIYLGAKNGGGENVEKTKAEIQRFTRP